MSKSAIPGVLAAVFLTCGVCAQSNQHHLSRKTVNPGNADFQDSAITAFRSVNYTNMSGSLTVVVPFSNHPLADPIPWTNLSGSTLGDAAYTGYTVGDTQARFSYSINPAPSPATRLQYAYDYSPRITIGSDGFEHLEFVNLVVRNVVSGGLLEIEMLIDGQWTLDLIGTGGLSRTFTPNGALPWTISEDFVYHAETNRTRFYASRISTGTGDSEGAVLQGYLRGFAVPAPNAAIALLMGCACARRRVRRHKNA